MICLNLVNKIKTELADTILDIGGDKDIRKRLYNIETDLAVLASYIKDNLYKNKTKEDTDNV